MSKIEAKSQFETKEINFFTTLRRFEGKKEIVYCDILIKNFEIQ